MISDMVRSFRPGWRLVLAVVTGLAVLLVGLDLGLGVLLTLVVAGAAVALVGAYFSARRPAPSLAQRRHPTRQRPQLQAGQEVITVRNLDGPFSEHVPAGTRGVITAARWDGVHASFTIYGPLGTRQAHCRVGADDVRRL